MSQSNVWVGGESCGEPYEWSMLLATRSVTTGSIYVNVQSTDLNMFDKYYSILYTVPLKGKDSDQCDLNQLKLMSWQ